MTSTLVSLKQETALTSFSETGKSHQVCLCFLLPFWISFQFLVFPPQANGSYSELLSRGNKLLTQAFSRQNCLTSSKIHLLEWKSNREISTILFYFLNGHLASGSYRPNARARNSGSPRWVGGTLALGHVLLFPEAKFREPAEKQSSQDSSGLFGVECWCCIGFLMCYAIHYQPSWEFE